MLSDLTPRERELFDLLLTGAPAKEIAHKLNISDHTVAFHRTKLYNKLGVTSIQELFTKYSTNGKASPPKSEAGEIIPIPDMGFFATCDSENGGNSTIEIYVTVEDINGVINNSVLNIKTNLAERVKNGELYAKTHTDKNDIIQRLRQANGIRFKALGDGKLWSVEFETPESRMRKNYACYTYMVRTIRDQVIAVDVPYSSLFLPEWVEHTFDFDKKTIKDFSITANFTQGYGSAFLQIFDFEIY